MKRALLAALSLVACGDSKPAAAPIVVAETSPTPSATPSASASAPASAPAFSSPPAQPAPETHAPPPASSADEPSRGNMWGDAIDDTPPRGGDGKLSSGPSKSAPSLRQGAVSVNGKLPPEVIQRIVRQNFGRFRLCYENGLRTNQKLGGRVAVRFTISRAGDVSQVGDGGSDLPDKAVVSCVTKGFQNLSFPQPQGGEVIVVYPIIFAPP